MFGPAAVGYNLHLLVEKIENLPLVSHDCSLVTQLEWRGSQRKAGLLGRGFVKNYTCPQQVQADSTVRWNEEFNHVCKLKREKYDCYRSWIVGLEIEEVQQKSREKKKIVGKAQLDVAGFVQLEDNKRTVRIPINCTIKGDTSEAMLLFTLLIKRALQELQQNYTQLQAFVWPIGASTSHRFIIV
ncbi:hypothetical protein HPP92_017509 [Vanilla planifolia]|uniref:C2 NT-type domain-containing protein n=1 Tax=Vanilla planifolia TaxID=51239 RepID=A0A835QCD2_VANPL|nr:hypothetical protein HPP92_017509 [Vanilla planifolia]